MGEVAVVIPVWQGARHLPGLIAALRRQTVAPDPILVIDSSSPDGSAELARSLGCQVEVIPQAEFNHGGTRNRGAQAAGARITVFLTQDALPADESFIERLVAPLRAGTAAAAYARQTAHPGADPPEVLARAWNYRTDAQLRTAADIARLGVKAYFFSNVASAVDMAAFTKVGCFPGDVIMNEDMILCARLLHAGRTVAYAADAVVHHSHSYTIAQQFRRYFDIGVFFATHGHLLPGARISGEGVRFVAWQCWRLLAAGRLGWAIRSPVENAAKLLGFRLGRRHRWLPAWLLRRCSMHAFHFARTAPAPADHGPGGTGA
jgi:rhamnosyltransferase